MVEDNLEGEQKFPSDTQTPGHGDLGLAVRRNCCKVGEDRQDSQKKQFLLAEDKLLGSLEVDMQNHS